MFAPAGSFFTASTLTLVNFPEKTGFLQCRKFLIRKHVPFCT